MTTQWVLLSHTASHNVNCGVPHLSVVVQRSKSLCTAATLDCSVTAVQCFAEALKS